MMQLGQVTKMKLKAFSDNTFAENKKVTISSGESEFVFLVNPETINRKFSLEYGQDNPQTATNGTYWHTKPEEFKVDILFDGTGVIKDPSFFNVAVVNPLSSASGAQDVSAQIAKLQEFCIKTQGNTHRPNFVKLFWGTEDGFFKGIAVSFDTDYKLFSREGKPIRAVVHLTLASALDPEQIQRAVDPQSPDISHFRQYKAGDKFTLICNNIYGKSEHYIDVAKANKMLSFRKIAHGSEIRFPPIKNRK